MLSPERKSDPATAALAIGPAAIAVACCAGLPAIAALLGGLTLGVVLGVGGPLLAALASALGAVVMQRRHRTPRSVRGGRR
jgi:hypothetical protein